VSWDPDRIGPTAADAHEVVRSTHCLEKVNKLSAVDWEKRPDSPWMRSQAGFAGQGPLFETLKDWIFLNKVPV
jgi:hypothetical protein